MTTLLANLTPETVGQIVGYAVAAALTGSTTYYLCKSRQAAAIPQEFATRKELKELETKHDRFENEMRATLRDSEQRTHKRLDLLASKMDESIGLQKGNSQIINRLLEHLILPSHDHQK